MRLLHPRRNVWSVVLGASAATLLLLGACGESSEPPALPGVDAAVAEAASPETPDAPAPHDGGGQPDATEIALPPCGVTEDATVSATLRVTADDHFKVWVNGVLVDDAVRAWSSPQTYAVTLFRSPKVKNVVAIEGINAFNQGGLDRGVIADLRIDAPDGGAADAGASGVLVSDTSWKIASAPAAGWNGVAFDDAAWAAPFDEGVHGTGPWGAVLGASTAHWLWTYDSAARVDKPASESVYLRRGFWFDDGGALSNVAGNCR